VFTFHKFGKGISFWNAPQSAVSLALKVTDPLPV